MNSVVMGNVEVVVDGVSENGFSGCFFDDY